MKNYWLLMLIMVASLTVFAADIDTNQRIKPSLRNEINLTRLKKNQSYIIPTMLVNYGIVSLGNNGVRRLDFSTKTEIDEHHSGFAMHVDDYIQYAPLVAIYGLNLAGIKGKHSVLDETAMILITTGITTTVVTPLKMHTQRLRPDESAYNSFPSGHTATAFAAAELLSQEFKDTSPWYGYAGYTLATATGVLRMYNNKHWLSDVVAGAGFGILSAKLTYIVYPHLKKIFIPNAKKSLMLVPSYQNQMLGFNLHGRF